MAKELTVTLVMTNPVGLKPVQKKITGTFDEIQKTINKLNTKSFDKDLNVTAKDVKLLQRAFQANKQTLEHNSGGLLKIKRSIKGVRAIYDATGKLIGGIHKKFIDDQGNWLKRNQLTVGSMKKQAKAVTNVERNVRRTTQTFGQLQRKIRDTFNKQRANMINQQTQQLSKMNARVASGASVTTEMAKKMDFLQKNIVRLGKVDISKVVRDFNDINNLDLSKAISEMNKFAAEEKGMVQGRMAGGGGGGGVGPGGGIGKRGGFSKIAGELSGAFGFGTIDVGLQIQNLFANKRVKGQITSAVGSLASTIGGAFGSMVGSIAGDLGKAFGTIGELMINLWTMNLRLAGVALGAAVRGLGIVIASGFIGAITGGLAGGPAGAIAGALSVMIIPSLFAIIAVVQELASEILDVVGKLFKAITSIISAGLKVIIGVISSSMKIVGIVWKAAWKGLKDVAKAVMDATLEFTRQFSSMLGKEISLSLKEFVSLEKGATRAAKEIANQGNFVKDFAKDIQAVRIGGGFEKADVAAAFFDTVSSGFRDTTERMKIISESSKLAIADTTGVANATNALITVYTSYGNKLSDITRIADVLSKTTTFGRTSLEELGPALRSVVGTAKFAGVGLEDLMSSITALTRVFGRGSTQSTTRFLSRFIEAIAVPTGNAAKEFTKLGVSVKSLGDGKNFTDTFVNLLTTLKGKVNFDNLRTLFPTNQSRKAFLALTNDVEGFKKLLNEVRNLRGLKEQQIAVIFSTLAKRIDRVKNIIQVARENFGQFFGAIIRATVFSDSFMRVWLKIGSLLSNRALSANIEKLGRLMAVVLLPVFRTFSGLVQQIGVFLRDLSIMDVNNNPFKDMLRDVKGIIAITTTWANQVAGVLDTTALIKLAFSDVAYITGRIHKFLQAINSGAFTFQNIIDSAKNIAPAIADGIANGITMGTSKASQGLDALTATLMGLGEGDLGLDLSPDQQLMVNNFKQLFDSISRLAQVAFRGIADVISVTLRDAFLSSTNFFVEKLKSIMKIVAVIDRHIFAIRALADLASGGKLLPALPATLEKMLTGELFKTKPEMLGFGQEKGGAFQFDNAKELSAALKKSGTVNDLDDKGISQTLRDLAFQGSDRKRQDLVSRSGGHKMQIELERFFRGFDAGKEALRDPRIGTIGNRDHTGFRAVMNDVINRMYSVGGAPHKVFGNKDFNPNPNSISSTITDMLDRDTTAAQLPFGQNDTERANTAERMTGELIKSSHTNTDILKAMLLRLEGNKAKVSNDPLIKSILAEKDAAVANHKRTQEHLMRIQAVAGIEKIMMGKSRAQYEARRKGLLAQIKQDGSNKKAINVELNRMREIASKERLKNLALTGKFALNRSRADNPEGTARDKFKFVLEAMSKNGIATNKEMISLLKRMFYSGRTDAQKKGILPMFAGLFAQAKNSQPKKGRDTTSIARKRTGGVMGFAQGSDRIPAMLAKGEAVIPRDAVEHFGSDFMRNIINQRNPVRARTGNPGVGGSKGKGGHKTGLPFNEGAIPGGLGASRKGGITDTSFVHPFKTIFGSMKEQKLKNQEDFAETMKKSAKRFAEAASDMEESVSHFDNMEKLMATMRGGGERVRSQNLQLWISRNNAKSSHEGAGVIDLMKIAKRTASNEDIRQTTTTESAKSLSLGRQRGRYLPADIARMFSKSAVDMLPKVRTHSTRGSGVARAKSGVSQFDSSPAMFSKKFRGGFGGFGGANAQQIVNNSRANRSRRNAGIVNPVMRKELPSDEQAKQTAFMRDILLTLKRNGETQSSLLNATTNGQGGVPANNARAPQGGDGRQNDGLGGA